MSKHYRIALVGCGGMGRQHIKALHDVPDFSVVALCDVSEESLALAGEMVEVAAYRDCATMCDEVKPDIVVVATETVIAMIVADTAVVVTGTVTAMIVVVETDIITIAVEMIVVMAATNTVIIRSDRSIHWAKCHT